MSSWSERIGPIWSTRSKHTNRLRRLLGLLVSIASISTGFWASTVLAQGTAALSWTPPTQNTDGSALTDLAGYSVHWGTEPDNYTESVTLNDPSLTGYTVENLTAGTWYFSARPFNESGIYADYSNPVSKTLIPVFGIVQSEDLVSLVEVGLVSDRVSCDTSQSVNGKYQVPTSEVEWLGSVRPVVVFADCMEP